MSAAEHDKLMELLATGKDTELLATLDTIIIDESLSGNDGSAAGSIPIRDKRCVLTVKADGKGASPCKAARQEVQSPRQQA